MCLISAYLPVWCDSFHLKGWSCGGLVPPPVVDLVVSTSPPNEAVGNANHREGGEPLLHRSKEAIAGSHTHLHFNPFDPYNRYNLSRRTPPKKSAPQSLMRPVQECPRPGAASEPLPQCADGAQAMGLSDSAVAEKACKIGRAS